MAGGKDIYIGEMLEGMQTSMQALEKSMGENAEKQTEAMNAQLDKLVAVQNTLLNIAKSTGVAKSETKFTGSTLTALTLTKIAAKGHCPVCFNDLASVNAAGTISLQINNNHGGAIFTIDCTDIDYLEGVYEKNSTYTAQIYIDGVKVVESTNAWDGKIDLTEYTGVHVFKVVSSSCKTNITTKWTPYINGEKLLFEAFDGVVEYSNSLMKMTSGTYAEYCIKPTFTGVSLWCEMLCSGIMDGIEVEFATADGATRLPLDVVSNMADISSWMLFDFYIIFKFTNTTDYISSMLFRYF